MTLSEISYAILEQIRSHRIVDDEEIDIRLVDSWVKNKRADILKNKVNSGCKINTVNTQPLSVSITRVASTVMGTHQYPYTDLTTQDFYLYKSTEKIPNILWERSGPLIIEITSSDKLKPPFSTVPFARLRFCGKGRFNSGLIYAAIDTDNYLYLNDKSFLGSDGSVTIKAIFEDPTEVTGFNVDTDDFPCSMDVIEAIKTSVFDKEFKVSLTAPEDDNASDANDEN